MTAEVAAGVLLIVVPIAFNLAFFELGRAFDYPNILREPPDTILRKFHAGGSGLILRWEALLLSALAMLPLVAMTAIAFGAAAGIAIASVVIGTAAALVQAIGLIRWPFAVPELARRYVAADGPDAAVVRAQVEAIFATLHRLLGVGIGEHLGYLLTGLWTLLIAASIMTTVGLPVWLGSSASSSGSRCWSGRSSSSGRTSARAGPSPGRSSRSPTSRGRCGSSRSGSACCCPDQLQACSSRILPAGSVT